ncbi:hypothetical protein KVF89_19535 [Nocardioides carbamazepini]|uniref:DUF3592 domain-containing protein n=1 Tax=Nocardioides carbamazepini TaxID=2854259 RepID=UPI00214A58DC|nr:DUF3592 domain-containing protein [Nocardioides carbamazepini]MCR1784744.1 hypothetical protein [Nocardioides carbamazepini]
MAHAEPPPFTFEPRRRRPLGLLIALCLLLIGGVYAGYGIGCTVIDAYEDAPPSYVAGDSIGIVTIGGTLAVVIGWLTWSLLVDRHPRALGQLHAPGVLLPAAAAGLLLASVELDVAGWYVGAAVIAGAAGVGLLLLAVAAATARRRRWRLELDLIARGTPVPATVAESGLDPYDFEEASNVITTAAFRFTGADGTVYRVHRRVVIPIRAPLVEGQRTTIWYDPDHPTDDRRIVVGIQHALRWNVPVPRVPTDRPAVPS